MKRWFYYVVRYVPNVAAGRFVNIGVFLHSPEAQFLDCLFTEDFRDVERLHPQADFEFLGELQLHFEQQISDREADLEGYIREMQASYSDLIQISDPQPCVAKEPHAALSQLLQTHVGGAVPARRKLDTRMRIKRRLAEAFEDHGVIHHKAFRKGVAAAEWTEPGDSFVFDFGYALPGPAGGHSPGTMLVHALSLRRDAELAQTLARKFQRVLEKVPARLTVAHEDVPEGSDNLVRSSRDALTGEHIPFVPVSSFDKFADWVRRELGA